MQHRERRGGARLVRARVGAQVRQVRGRVANCGTPGADATDTDL